MWRQQRGWGYMAAGPGRAPPFRRPGGGRQGFGKAGFSVKEMLARFRLGWLALGLLGLASCTFLGNQSYVKRHPGYQGIQRVVVFLQRWPVYRQLPGQNEPGEEFIKPSTAFLGPWEAAGRLAPRAVDIADIDDDLMGGLLCEVLQSKGYQPVMGEMHPGALGSGRVEEIMARYQAVDRQVDAFLFCFYSPTLFVAEAGMSPPGHGQRSYGLGEIVEKLKPGEKGVLWAGPRAGKAPPRSISHAFIYVSLTLFRAHDWHTLWKVADSQVGGRPPPRLVQCPPAPTSQDFWADAGIIRNLMRANLRCRLRHLIPDAFQEDLKLGRAR